MNTPIQKTLTQTLTLLCALSVSALNVFAQNLIVTSDTTVSGTHYENNGNDYAALTNTGSWTFTGSDVTLTAAGGYYSLGGRGAYFTGGGKLNLTDSAISADGNYAMYFSNSSAATLDNVNIISDGDYGIYMAGSGTLKMTGGTISNRSDNAVSLDGLSVATLDNANISGRLGISAYASALTVTGGTINGTNTGLSLNDGTTKLDDVNIISDGGYGIYTSAATLTVIGGTISGDSYGIYTHGSNITLDDVNIISVGEAGIHASGTLKMTGGTISGAYYGIEINNGGTATVNNVNITTSNGIHMEDNKSTLTMTDSAINADRLGINLSGSTAVTLNNTTVTVTSASGYGVNLYNSSTLTLTDSAISATGSNARGLYVSYNEKSSTHTVNLNHSTLAGGIYNIEASGDVSLGLIITASDGSTITGDVISTQNAVVQITLTDAGTALRGNLIQDPNGAITLTIGADALLEGGGTVSNLIMDTGAILGYTDELTVTTSITIGDGIIIDFSGLTATGDYTVLDWSGATGGESISDDQFTIAGDGVEGTFNVDNGKLVFNATAVPEPSTWFLIGLGLGTLALIRRR
ncbi:MAG: right-handed parallel beta-helix repeat-containing protein [Verrucomicrobiales bacterium]|nr:right-handed parallel beta-helix repeat-containing protein [Verrucomicrobiales bacterium]